jgi:hypothetical protein
MEPPMTSRRDFLRLLGLGATVAASGLLVPEPRRVYSFLTNNPLALRTPTATEVATIDRWMMERLLEIAKAEVTVFHYPRKIGLTPTRVSFLRYEQTATAARLIRLL